MKKNKSIAVGKALARALCIALLTVLFALSVTGCGLFDRNHTDDSFAYDGAVSGGYQGTESEWLASLDTPSTRERRLYEDAVRSGAYSGSYFDFLKSLQAGGAEDALALNGALNCVVCIEATFPRTVFAPESVSSGAGVIYSLDTASGDAYIVTNYHVLYSAKHKTLSSNIKLYLYGETTKSKLISATYYGGVMSADVAVLKVTGSALLKETSEHHVTACTVCMADSDSLTVGERVYAIGNPNGEGFSVTGGVASVVSEFISAYAADESTVISLPEIRTDTAVNHGNSGGGLFNAQGELVGIVNARREESGLNGFGYALPVNFVDALVGNLLGNSGRVISPVQNLLSSVNNKFVSKGLGITAYVADSKGVYNETTGKYYIEQKVAIESVEVTSAAYAAGLRRGDTILSIARNGEQIACTDLFSFTNLLLQSEAGDTLTFNVSRSNERLSFQISLQSSHMNVLG